MSRSTFARLIAICLTAVCLHLQFTTAALSQDRELLECVDDRYDAMVVLHDANAMVELFTESSLSSHPLVEQVMRHLESSEVKKLIASEIGPWASGLTAAILSQLPSLQGDVTALISFQETNGVRYLCSVSSQSKDATSAVKSFLSSLDLKTDGGLFKLTTSDDEVLEISVGNLSMVAVVAGERLLVSSSRDDLLGVASALNGGQVPERPFLENRKFRRGAFQSRTSDGKQIVSLFLDPKSLEGVIPQLPLALAKALGGSELTTIYLDCRRPEAKLGQKQPELAINCWVGISKPWPESIESVLNPETEWRIPVDIDLEGTFETMAWRCDPRPLYHSIESQLDQAFGDGYTRDLLVSVDRHDRLASGFTRRVIDSFGGQFLSVNYIDDNQPPAAFLSINEAGEATAIVSELANRARKGGLSKIEPSVGADGIVRWNWSERQLESHYQDLSTRLGTERPQDLSRWQPWSFAMRDSIVIYSRLGVIRELERTKHGGLDSAPFYKKHMALFRKYTESIDDPVFIWTSSPEYWRTYVASLRWRLQQEYGKEIPFLEFDADGPVETDLSSDDLKVLVQQIKLRLAYVACDFLGEARFAVFPAEFGAQGTLLLFSSDVDD